MKTCLTILTLILVLGMGVTMANAQSTPVVQVYFNWGEPTPTYFYQTYDCTPATMDSFYVVARFFNMQVSGIEYAVNYPAGIAYVAETPSSPLAIGKSLDTDPSGGMTIVWEMPQNGAFPILCSKVLYMCNSCIPDSPIIVVPHGLSGFVRATRYSDNEFVNAIGMTSIFCPEIIPVEETTWGSIKALYKD